MKPFLMMLALWFAASTLATAQSLNQFQWKSRLVLLFTPDPGDPMFEEQARLLRTQNEAFQERDAVFMFITPEGKFENTGIFLDESMSRQYYERFSPNQYEFTMILVGYDGEEKYRAANRLTPPSVLINLIDNMPMRRRELLQGDGNESFRNDWDNTSVPTSTRRDY